MSTTSRTGRIRSVFSWPTRVIAVILNPSAGTQPDRKSRRSPGRAVQGRRRAGADHRPRLAGRGACRHSSRRRWRRRRGGCRRGRRHREQCGLRGGGIGGGARRDPSRHAESFRQGQRHPARSRAGRADGGGRPRDPRRRGRRQRTDLPEQLVDRHLPRYRRRARGASASGLPEMDGLCGGDREDSAALSGRRRPHHVPERPPTSSVRRSSSSATTSITSKAANWALATGSTAAGCSPTSRPAFTRAIFRSCWRAP